MCDLLKQICSQMASVIYRHKMAEYRKVSAGLISKEINIF
jgi:hypothetical protein